MVPVLFTATDRASTKATGVTAEGEAAITRWAVFAFEDGGTWFRYETSEGGEPIPMNLKAGTDYTCYAIVNYPVSGTGAFVPAAVRSESDLTGKVAWLGDNAAGRLLMFGSEPVTPSATFRDPEHPETAVSQTRSIRVRRVVSKICVDGVSVDFSGQPLLAGKTFTLRHIYVTNAYRTARYGSDYGADELSGARASWYNTGGWHRGESGEDGMDALLGDRDINAVITQDSPHTSTHSFYVFPNVTAIADDDHQMDVWTRRCTRIVIEATLGDEAVYYRIDVPSMERNHIYTATDVVIHGKGSSDPEVPDSDADPLDVTITWQDGWDGDGGELDL